MWGAFCFLSGEWAIGAAVAAELRQHAGQLMTSNLRLALAVMPEAGVKLMRAI